MCNIKVKLVFNITKWTFGMSCIHVTFWSGHKAQLKPLGKTPGWKGLWSQWQHLYQGKHYITHTGMISCTCVVNYQHLDGQCSAVSPLSTCSGSALIDYPPVWTSVSFSNFMTVMLPWPKLPQSHRNPLDLQDFYRCRTVHEWHHYCLNSMSKE